MKQIRVRRAATGWTIRIEDKEDRAAGGSEKSASSLLLPKRVWESAHNSCQRVSKALAKTWLGLESSWSSISTLE